MAAPIIRTSRKKARKTQQPSMPLRSTILTIAAEYGGGCVELDALPPNELIVMVRGVIMSEIDVDRWLGTEQVEALERQTLESIASISWQAGTTYAVNEEAGE